VALAKSHRAGELPHVFTGSVEHAIAHIEESIAGLVDDRYLRWYAIKVFERDDKVMAQLNLTGELKAHLEAHIADCEKELDDDAESIITNQRYAYINGVVNKAVKKKAAAHSLTTSDKIDRIVTNRILALPIFAAVMFAVYYVAIGTVGDWVTGWTNDVLFGEIVPPAVSGWLEGIGTAPWLQGLIVDGIIAGVGAVLGFVPQMLVLFLMLAFLEACGYMARIAFVLDRVFRKFGLSGKSFIPMLIGVGCGVPGIMASRTIENERDRRMTVMTTTFIPCGAKVPFIAMIAGAIFGGSAWVSTSAYFIGMAAIIVSGIMLKKTKMFAGDPAPFVMELPAYHWPTLGNVLRSMWERGWSFIKKAGTIILLSTIFVWFTTYFGWVDGTFRMLDESEIQSSILAAIGGVIAWIFKPLGWGNWQAAVASITGLVAKENIVGTLGILYGGGDGTVYQNIGAAFTGISGFSFLVFNLLCAPCFAAIGAIKREMNNRKWTWFAIGYQCGFAYLISLMINQFGGLFTGSVNVIGLIFALAALALMVYMLVRPYKEATKLNATV
jgi:ferrous iron transport protein B